MRVDKDEYRAVAHFAAFFLCAGVGIQFGVAWFFYSAGISIVFIWTCSLIYDLLNNKQ